MRGTQEKRSPKESDPAMLSSGQVTSVSSQSSWARQAGASAEANGSRVRATVSRAALHQWSAISDAQYTRHTDFFPLPPAHPRRLPLRTLRVERPRRPGLLRE